MLSKQLIDDVSTMLIKQLSLYIEANKAQMAEQAGLLLSDYKALEFIVEFEVLATGQLAQLLNLSASGVSALISRLEQAGYISRDRHPLDRRIVAIIPIKERCQQIIATPQQELLIALEAVAQQHPSQILAMHDFLIEAMGQLKTSTLTQVEQS